MPMSSSLWLVAALAWQPPASITAAAENAVTQIRPGASVSASIDDKIRMPACSRPLQTEARMSGRSSAMATVRCSGESQWQLYVPVRLTEELSVVILKRPVARGEPLTLDDLEQVKRSSASLAYGHYSDPSALIGQTLRRSLGKGMVLSPGDVVEAVSIRPGTTVTLLSRHSGIEVRTQGRVVHSSGQGLVRVENLTSGQKVSGRHIAPGLVEVLP